MANDLFMQSRGFASLLKSYKGIDYSTCPVNVLADGYCDATDNGDDMERDMFISGLILRFWFAVKKMQEKSPGLGYGEDEFANWLYEAIESGEFYLVATNMQGQVENPSEQVGIASDPNLSDVRYDKDEAKAKAEYDAAMNKINRKEKLIDSQISRLNTEYTAISTERETIQQIMSDNVQSSFKLFG